jgi:hypothetical protein
MEIQFDLVYEESEPITSMSVTEYIPVIGSDVLFNNIIYDENDDEFTLCFHATVINHFYDTGCDILHIICNKRIETCTIINILRIFSFVFLFKYFFLFLIFRNFIFLINSIPFIANIIFNSFIVFVNLIQSQRKFCNY